MIRYALVCEKAHKFESWFSNSAGFEAQAARGLVACPLCGSAKVDRAIMAPAVARTDLIRAVPVEPAEAPSPGGGGSSEGPAPKAGEAGAGSRAGAGSSPVPVAPPEPVALISEKEVALRAMLRAVREHVVGTAENVGPRFAEEALKIHHGETEHRSIYGEASPDDVEALREEGVAFSPLPRLPEGWN